jgi:hypothetical protein
MNRTGHDDVDFFYGTEVEHTPAYGKPTLFVVGVQSVDDIARRIKGMPGYDMRYGAPVEHIFFGANHSFDPKNNLDWQRWESMVGAFLSRGYLCSLDIPITAVADFNDTGLCEFRNFIPQIRVSIPYTKLWNYNTMLKIDDADFDATNPGVWTHSLHSLMSRETFTSWDEYSKDQTV